MRLTYTAAVVTLVALIVLLSRDMLARELTPGTTRTLEAALVDASRVLTNDLPLMVDDETRLDACSAAEGAFTYEYTLVNIAAENVDLGAFATRLRSQTTTRACRSSLSRRLLDEGIVLVYAYRGVDGIPLASVAIAGSDC